MDENTLHSLNQLQEGTEKIKQETERVNGLGIFIILLYVVKCRFCCSM